MTEGHTMMRCNRCGATPKPPTPCPYSVVPCEARMTVPVEDWVGNSPRDCGEHRTTGPRAWCFDDHTWCYPHDPCAGCTTREQQIADAVALLRDAGFEVRKP